MTRQLLVFWPGDWHYPGPELMVVQLEMGMVQAPRSEHSNRQLMDWAQSVLKWWRTASCRIVRDVTCGSAVDNMGPASLDFGPKNMQTLITITMLSTGFRGGGGGSVIGSETSTTNFQNPASES